MESSDMSNAHVQLMNDLDDIRREINALCKLAEQKVSDYGGSSIYFCGRDGKIDKNNFPDAGYILIATQLYIK